MLAQRLAVVEQGHAAAAQVINSVVTNLDETRAISVTADTVLRSELVDFAAKLKISEDYVKSQVEAPSQPWTSSSPSLSP